MTFALLAPLGLFALAAWALPILIHLVRRIELHATEFAALRWISARVPPRRRIRFERPWLLLLRIVLLALLALLLARPVIETAAPGAQPRVFVVPGAERPAALATIDAAAAQVRWLAPGFPPFDQAAPPGAVPLASLLREADAMLPAGARLQVVAPRELGGLDGERVRLAHALDWEIVDGHAPALTAAASTPVRFAVRHADGDEAALRWLRAAVQAWNLGEPGRYLLDEATLDAPLAADTRWLAWLAPQVPPAISNWIEAGGTALLVQQSEPRGDVLWRDADAHVLARVAGMGEGRAISLPSALAPEALPVLFDAEFPERLRIAMQGPAMPPDRATAAAAQPAIAGDGAASAGTDPFAAARPLDAWLALLAAALFLVERLVATARAAEREA
jgi:hypothetical protein